jgi:NitT/TauT family transport system ATP-binding protein
MLMKSNEFKQDSPLIIPNADTVLFAGRVDKTYPNGTHALDDVRLRVQRGEFISLLGPSGCGKSTLLRMFAGLDTPSAGQIRWWNEATIPEDRPGHSMAMVFQEATLMPWANIASNARLPLDLRHIARGESEARVARALDLVGLSKFHQAYPRELSGGMQMRASIARALATEPNVLLMDEPFGALDEFTRNRLDADLRKLWAHHDLTVVFVTHSIYEAVFLSSKVVVMGARPGRILAEVDIQGPRNRDESFRVSSDFMAYCQQLSELLTLANGSEH